MSLSWSETFSVCQYFYVVVFFVICKLQIGLFACTSHTAALLQQWMTDRPLLTVSLILLLYCSPAVNQSVTPWIILCVCVCAGCKYTCHTACRGRVSLDCHALASPVSQDQLNNNTPLYVSTLHCVCMCVCVSFVWLHQYFYCIKL